MPERTTVTAAPGRRGVLRRGAGLLALSAAAVAGYRPAVVRAQADGAGRGASAAVAAAAAASAAPPEVIEALPAARLQGQGSLRMFGLRIFDARLWLDAPWRGEAPAQPLALELRYARALSGARIAARSIQEMRGIGAFDDAQAARWELALRRLFPDVEAGQRLTGVWRPGAATRFAHDGRWLGQVDDEAFGPLFFGIWLAARSSEPALRDRLLGRAGG
ncbi:MAG: hypothetical protein RIQ53_2933 [Pseudomonadota bacterium]|jgi:hypothetical protein